MNQFFFSLDGGQNVDDRFGIRFETELQAFQPAQRMAEELSEWRPALGAWVALTQDGSEDIYCVSVNRRPARKHAADN